MRPSVISRKAEHGGIDLQIIVVFEIILVRVRIEIVVAFVLRRVGCVRVVIEKRQRFTDRAQAPGAKSFCTTFDFTGEVDPKFCFGKKAVNFA
jgi:hypothetical protein